MKSKISTYLYVSRLLECFYTIFEKKPVCVRTVFFLQRNLANEKCDRLRCGINVNMIQTFFYENRFSRFFVWTKRLKKVTFNEISRIRNDIEFVVVPIEAYQRQYVLIEILSKSVQPFFCLGKKIEKNWVLTKSHE